MNLISTGEFLDIWFRKADFELGVIEGVFWKQITEVVGEEGKNYYTAKEMSQ